MATSSTAGAGSLQGRPATTTLVATYSRPTTGTTYLATTSTRLHVVHVVLLRAKPGAVARPRPRRPASRAV